MAEPQQSSVVILRKVNYADQDLIVTLFGRDVGKFSAIAKGARASKKRFGGGLQPMRLLLAIYSRKQNQNMAFLREISVLDDFSGIASSFDKITAASYATELVREVAQADHPEPETFDLLTAFYADLSARAPNAGDELSWVKVILFQFELRLLALQGALPAFKMCFRCGRSRAEMDKFRLMRSGEGLICAECRRAGEAVGVVSAALLDLLYYLESPEGSAPKNLGDAADHRQIRRVLDASFEHLLERPLKSRGLLDTLFFSS